MYALITGASRGIGLAVAKKFIREKITTIGISRKKPPLDHPLFSWEACDLADLDGLEKRLVLWKRQFPPLDILVLNAGKGAFGHLEEWGQKEIKDLFHINVLSSILIAKAFLPIMKREKRGKVIFIGSESALIAKREGSIYSATKFALRGFASAIRDECRNAGIAVTSIHPGLVKTPFFDGLDFAPGEKPEEHLLPEDVAEAVFLAAASRPEIIVDEIVLSPRKPRIVHL